MAKTERSTDIAKPPDDVFPYLFEADKVPQWTTGLHSYERLDGGALGKGSKFRENLEVSGQKIDAELEITAFEPPHRAESRTEIRGIDVISTYELTPSGSGTRLTQTIEASRRRPEGPRADPRHPAAPGEEARRRPRRAGLAPERLEAPGSRGL